MVLVVARKSSRAWQGWHERHEGEEAFGTRTEIHLIEFSLTQNLTDRDSRDKKLTNKMKTCTEAHEQKYCSENLPYAKKKHCVKMFSSECS